MSDLEIDQKKRYLKRYKKNKALIDRLEAKLTDLDERICRIRSPKFSDMPKGGTPVDLADLIDDKLELERRINRLVQKGRSYKSEILDIIDEAEDPRHAEVLEAFLIDCKTFEEIAEESGYTTRHVIRLYSKAVDSIKLSVNSQ